MKENGWMAETFRKEMVGFGSSNSVSHHFPASRLQSEESNIVSDSEKSGQLALLPAVLLLVVFPLNMTRTF
jgi:hypothetical protein